MTKQNGTQENQSPAITMIKRLFNQVREIEATQNLGAARHLEQRITKLVAQVAAKSPNSAEHAEALSYHEYTLLSVARTAQRQDTKKLFRNLAYAQGAAAVAIRMQFLEHEVGTVLAAYNLGIDLICSENRPVEGLALMLQARAVLERLAGKKKLPANLLHFKLFDLNYGIAKAHYDLGNRKTARTICKRSLYRAPALHTASWGCLRGVARMADMLAQIHLDEIHAKRSVEAAKDLRQA